MSATAAFERNGALARGAGLGGGVGHGRVGVVTEVDVRRFILAWLVGWGGTGDDKA